MWLHIVNTRGSILWRWLELFAKDQPAFGPKHLWPVVVLATSCGKKPPQQECRGVLLKLFISDDHLSPFIWIFKAISKGARCFFCTEQAKQSGLVKAAASKVNVHEEALHINNYNHKLPDSCTKHEALVYGRTFERGLAGKNKWKCITLWVKRDDEKRGEPWGLWEERRGLSERRFLWDTVMLLLLFLCSGDSADKCLIEELGTEGLGGPSGAGG